MRGLAIQSSLVFSAYTSATVEASSANKRKVSFWHAVIVNSQIVNAAAFRNVKVGIKNDIRVERTSRNASAAAVG